MPIVELVQIQDSAAEAEGILGVFVAAYQAVGIPFTLGYVVVGVSAMMVARYTTSFAVAWFREALRTYYIRDLQTQAFRNALSARVEYFDKEGSDNILNAIVTQTYYAGRVIQRGIKFSEQAFFSWGLHTRRISDSTSIDSYHWNCPWRILHYLPACARFRIRRR